MPASTPVRQSDLCTAHTLATQQACGAYPAVRHSHRDRLCAALGLRLEARPRTTAHHASLSFHRIHLQSVLVARQGAGEGSSADVRGARELLSARFLTRPDSCESSIRTCPVSCCVVSGGGVARIVCAILDYDGLASCDILPLDSVSTHRQADPLSDPTGCTR